jgi:nucleotide-binding universal stress UspA family protein
MSYKTILVHCDASPKLSQRLDVAVDLAQRHGAYLVGVHVQAPFDVPAFADGMMPMDDLFTSYEAAAKADHDAAKASFEKAIKGTHLPTE